MTATKRLPLQDYPARRIGLIKPSALGDIVHALPVLTALRRRYPDAFIAWVVNRNYEGLLQGHPDLDATLPFERGAARHGMRRDGSRLVSRSDAKRINAVMLTCGTYDAAGEFAYRVGVPAKSGIAGGILAIIPGRCSLCVWSPGLDNKGNSIAGIAALDAFTTLTGWSVF